MGDLITVNLVDAMAAGSEIRLTRGTLITPAARDAAEARGIAIVDAAEDSDATTPGENCPRRAERLGGVRAADLPNPATHGEAEQVIVTAVGRNRPRILSEITSTIAELNGNVMDINQRILQDYFTTIMIVDITPISCDFATFKQTLESISRPEDYRVSVQHEKVFQYMHRI